MRGMISTSDHDKREVEKDIHPAPAVNHRLKEGWGEQFLKNKTSGGVGGHAFCCWTVIGIYIGTGVAISLGVLGCQKVDVVRTNKINHMVVPKAIWGHVFDNRGQNTHLPRLLQFMRLHPDRPTTPPSLWATTAEPTRCPTEIVVEDPRNAASKPKAETPEWCSANSEVDA